MKKNREHFVTCGQMKILEQRADADGLSYYRMMENAGVSAAEAIMETDAYRRLIAGKSDNGKPAKYKVAEAEAVENTAKSPNGDSAGRVFVFCGKGNNGGDGFVAARVLCNAGYEVSVFLVDGLPVTEDSKTNFELLGDLPVNIFDMTVNERILMELKQPPQIIVDAIYGTGFHGRLEGNALKAAIYINRAHDMRSDLPGSDETIVFSLDIPSGLAGDLTIENEPERSSITAHYTIAFHARKPVHLQKFASRYCGKIIVADIGIDEERLWNVEI